MDSNWKQRRMEQLPEEEYLLWKTQWGATQADRKRRKADNTKQTINTGTVEMVIISLRRRSLGSTTHGIASPKLRRGRSVTPYKCQALTSHSLDIWELSRVFLHCNTKAAIAM